MKSCVSRERNASPPPPTIAHIVVLRATIYLENRYSVRYARVVIHDDWNKMLIGFGDGDWRDFEQKQTVTLSSEFGPVKIYYFV